MQRWEWKGGRKTEEGYCSVTETEYTGKGRGLYLEATLCFLPGLRSFILAVDWALILSVYKL